MNNRHGSSRYSAVKSMAILLSILLVSSLLNNTYASSDARGMAIKAYELLEYRKFDTASTEEALRLIKKANEIAPKEAWVHIASSQAILTLGYNYGNPYKKNAYQEGALESALVFANRAVAMDPKSAQAHAQLARVLIINRQHKKAWNTLNTTHQLDNNNFYAWYLRAIISIQMRDTRKAKGYFAEARSRAKNNYQHSWINLRLTDVAESEGDTKEQERLYLDNIQLFSDSAHAYGNYANFLRKQKRYEESIDYYQRAIDIEPYPLAERELEKVKQLRDRQQSPAK